MSWGFASTAAGAPPSSPRPTNVVEIPQPLDDTTHNVNAKAEYVGTTFFGTRWTTNVKYTGSFYESDVKRIDIENPFCFTCSLFAGTFRGPNALQWVPPPDNHVNGMTSNTAIDLPFWKSRIVTTVQYNAMRQNDPFVNTGTNGVVMPPVTLVGIPVNGLDGKVDTFLWNNVYTAQVTKDVKLTMRGRHYDVDNRTPVLHIDNWIWGDSGCAAGQLSLAGVCPPVNPRNSLPISYTKDNASAEATWRAVRWATVGGGVFWERWDRKFRDVDVTDEVSGKAFVDVNPLDTVHARASYLYAQRRYDTYDHVAFVEDPALQSSEVVSNLRKFDIANRNRHKAEAMAEWTPGRMITFSPNFGLRWDDYPDPVNNPLGVRSDHSWNAGIEVAATFGQSVRLMAAYNYEDRRLDMAGGSGGANLDTGSLLTGCPTDAALNPDHVIGTACTWRSDIHQQFHTYMFAGDVKVIPSKLDVRFEYLSVQANEQNNTTPCAAPGFSCNGLTSGVPASAVNFGQFPTERNNFQRFNVIARYYVDPSVVRQAGWVGDVVLKVRYTWERNHNVNWANDEMTPYVPTPDTTELTGANRSIFLAASNPNYDAQVIAMSVAVKW